MSRFCLNLNIRGIEGPALLAVLIVAAIRAVVTQDLVFGDEVAYLSGGQAISQGLFLDSQEAPPTLTCISF